MRKKAFLILILFSFICCESNRERCIKDLVDNKGYLYEDACDACDEMANDSVRE